jgi:SAM-dependent methyltransferase
MLQRMTKVSGVLQRSALWLGLRLVEYGRAHIADQLVEDAPNGTAEAAQSATPQARRPHARPGKPIRDDYAARTEKEIERFRRVENVHDLPEIFHFWSNRYVRPKLEAVFGVSKIEDFYAKYILRYREEHPQDAIRIASIGSGNSDMEISLAKALRERGLQNFRFDCLDINPDMLKRGQELADTQALGDCFSFLQTDAAEWQVDGPYGIVIAHHSLHHFVNLERIFANIRDAIDQDGCFLTCDMIGRNGHMRWPEALEVVHAIWRTMPDRYKYNHQLSRIEELYENWDCSHEGFEGIRAQDILPLLIKSFAFEAFIAYGNLPEVFVDRGFGHNFDPTNAEDIEFIDRIGALNDALISEGKIKPTQMMAVLRPFSAGATLCYQHWTPEFCVREVPVTHEAEMLYQAK